MRERVAPPIFRLVQTDVQRRVEVRVQTWRILPTFARRIDLRAGRELAGAHYRLDRAQERLEQFGPLSQLRPRGRHEKASTVDQIDRFTNDIRKAEAKIAGCEQKLEELRPELGRRFEWDIEHQFPDSRLRTIDAELADLDTSADHRLPSNGALLRRAPGEAQVAWPDHLAEISRPPLPGRDLGIDLGL